MKKRLWILIICVLFSSCAGELAKQAGLVGDDMSQPEVVDVYPSNHMTNVPSDAVIVVRFSKEMDTVHTNNQFSLSSSSGSFDGYFSWDNGGKTMTFQPKEPLEGTGMFTLSVSSGAEDVDGNDLKEAYTSVFYVNTDLAPPEIVLYEPLNDVTGVLPDANIVITFSEAIDLDSLYDGITISPAVAGLYQWNPTYTEITFDPLYNLSYGTTYTVTVSDSIKDINGNPLVDPFTFNFTVGDDFVKPTLTVSQPDISAALWAEDTVNTLIEKDSYLAIDFSEEIDTSELYDAVNISPACEFYLTEQVIGMQTRVNIMFIEPMESEENYTLTISPVITDLQNNALDHEYVFSYLTDGTNSIAPRVTAIGDSGGPVWTMDEVVTRLITVPPFYNDVEITFSANANMEPTSISVSVDFVVGQSGTVSVINPEWPNFPNLPYIYRFDMSGVQGATTYKITVKGGENGARDVNGNYMKEDFVQYIRF